MIPSRLRLAALAGTCAATSFVFGLPVIARQTSGDTAALGDYRNLMHEYRQNVVKPGEKAWEVRDRLRAVRSVTLPDGSRVTVNNGVEADALDRRMNAETGKRERRTLQTRAAMLEAIVSPPRRTFAAKADPKTAALDILSAGEFKKADAPKHEATWLEKATKWLLDSLERILSRIFSWFRPKGSVDPALITNLATFVQFALYFALAVGAIVGLYFLARLILQQKPEWRKRKRKNNSDTGLDLSPSEAFDPLSSAQTLANNGDYRGAIRLIYNASLRRLAVAGLLVLARDKTNWEYQRALRAQSPAAYAALLPATRLFDRIWYGRTQATREEYEAAVAAHGTLPDAPEFPAARQPASQTAGTVS